MTANYWEIGRRVVELEQGGRQKAKYGAQVIERMAADLTARFGRCPCRAEFPDLVRTNEE